VEAAGDKLTDILSLPSLLVGRHAAATKCTTCLPKSHQPNGFRLPDRRRAENVPAFQSDRPEPSRSRPGFRSRRIPVQQKAPSFSCSEFTEILLES